MWTDRVLFPLKIKIKNQIIHPPHMAQPFSSYRLYVPVVSFVQIDACLSILLIILDYPLQIPTITPTLVRLRQRPPGTDDGLRRR